MKGDKCIMCGQTIPEGRMVCPNCDMTEPNFGTTKVRVLLNKIADIPEFVNLVSKCNDDVVVKSGKYAVNGKSLMGLYSLDLTKSLSVEFYGNIPFEVVEGMKNFIID